MIRLSIILIIIFLAVPNTNARDRQSLSDRQVGEVFSFYNAQTGFGQKNQYFRDTDENLDDGSGNFRKYSVFYFTYGDDVAGRTVSSTHFLNRYTGELVYRQSNCIRYYSQALENYRKKIRAQTPYSKEKYSEEHDHFLKISEPISLNCFENEKPEKLLSLAESESFFYKFLLANKLLQKYGYYAEKYSTPLNEIESDSDFDYYKFTLIRVPYRKNNPPPRLFFMNAWTGEFYEQGADNPCTLWSSPALRAARAKLYAAKNLTDADLAPHHAHFRTITDPRSANCLGDRLDGLVSVDEEIKAGQALRKAAE